MSHNTHRLCSSVFNTLLFEAMTELLFDDSVICDLIRETNHTGEAVQHVPHLTHTWRPQLALCTRVRHRKGDLTLHPLMELFHKLAAVLLCDTCKLHCLEEDLPSAMVTVSLPPFVKAILNSFLLIKGVVLVAQFNLLWGKPDPLEDGFAFTSSLSTDVFSEEDSVSITHCNGDKRWDTADHTHYSSSVALQCCT